MFTTRITSMNMRRAGTHESRTRIAIGTSASFMDIRITLTCTTATATDLARTNPWCVVLGS